MKTSACLFVVAASAAALAGCGSNSGPSYKSITGDLTPELHGVSERKADDHNAFAVAANANLRMFWDDIGRALYLDESSRLSPFPITYTSGQPR